MQFKVMENILASHGIPFLRIGLDSPAGQALAAFYDFRASPGILVDGAGVNLFDLLVHPGC